MMMSRIAEVAWGLAVDVGRLWLINQAQALGAKYRGRAEVAA
jgi:hypothetical protein